MTSWEMWLAASDTCVASLHIKWIERLMTVNVFLAIPAAHTRWHPACAMRNAQQPHHCSGLTVTSAILISADRKSHSSQAAKPDWKKKRMRSHKYGVSRKRLETDWNLWVKSTVGSLPRDPLPFYSSWGGVVLGSPVQPLDFTFASGLVHLQEMTKV